MQDNFVNTYVLKEAFQDVDEKIFEGWADRQANIQAFFDVGFALSK